MKRVLVGCGIFIIILTVALVIAIRLVLPTVQNYLRYGYTNLPLFMERREASFDGHPVSFLVSKFSPDSLKWSLINDPSSPKSVKDWRQNLNADIVINGAYFDEKNEPTGFYQSSNIPSITPWPSTMDLNGYTFAVNVRDGKMNLYFVPASSLLGPYEGSTFLSFPTLLLNDTSMITTDSGLHARRTVLAQTDDDTIFVITSELGEESLYQMAQWLVAQPEHFRIAGNLDGGPSTGLSTASTPWNIDIHSAPIPNIIVGKL